MHTYIHRCNNINTDNYIYIYQVWIETNMSYVYRTYIDHKKNPMTSPCRMKSHGTTLRRKFLRPASFAELSPDPRSPLVVPEEVGYDHGPWPFQVPKLCEYIYIYVDGPGLLNMVFT